MTASDGGQSDNFGTSVSMGEDVAMVGAPWEESRAGAVYVFQYSDGVPTATQKLTPLDRAENQSFGGAVSIDGDFALVGARGDDDLGQSVGAAYIFQRIDNVWVEVQKLIPTDGDDYDNFGNSVSLSGGVALIGAVFDTIDGVEFASGSAYVFRLVNGIWIEEQKLTVSDATFHHDFGSSVSVSGDVALIGAPGNDHNGTNAGAAYVFSFNDDHWSESQVLRARNGTEQAHFGVSVSVKGDQAIIGAVGAHAAYLFQSDGIAWNFQQQLTASTGDANIIFGLSVAVNDDVAVVGVKSFSALLLYEDPGVPPGSAYVFQYKKGVWFETDRLKTSDEQAHDNFGHSVAIYGNRVLVGAPGENIQSENDGSAYIFELSSIPVSTKAQFGKSESLPKFLRSSYPNPFTHVTTIGFDLPQASDVTLIVYDLLGKEVIRLIDQELPASYHEASWNASGMPSGLYLFRLTTDSFSATKKVVLLN